MLEQEISITSKTLSNQRGFNKWLRGRFKLVNLNLDRDDLRDDRLIRFLENSDYVILGTEPFHKGIIEACPSLKAVFKYGVGVDNVDFEACEEANLPVYYRKGTNSDAVAEIALSYIIQLLRKQHLSFHNARRGKWDKTKGKEIGESTIGILGLGHVGQCLRKKILGVNPTTKIIFNDTKEAYRNCPGYVSVDELFETSDIVSIHIDNENRDNTNFVSNHLLGKMKKGAYLVNTARGSVLNYYALKDYMEKLGGVALDVYPHEPEIPVFLQHSSNLLSCHICGSSERALANGETFIKQAIKGHLNED